MSFIKPLRRLPLSHAYNVRDLGGYPIGDTSMTAWNRCYRSDNLHALKDSDWRVLQEVPIALIIDLRSSQEQKEASYDGTTYGIRCLSIPFMKETEAIENSLSEEAKQKFLKSMKLDYVEMLQDGSQAVHTALEEIAHTLRDGQAVLFHCTAGKDRTGMLACILFALCGVNRLDILADYQVSATYNEVGVNRMLPKERMVIPSVKAMFESTPEMLTPMLDVLDVNGCEAYLKGIGVSQQTMDIIREQLIVSIE